MHLKYNINRHDKGLKVAPALFPNPGGPVQNIVCRLWICHFCIFMFHVLKLFVINLIVGQHTLVKVVERGVNCPLLPWGQLKNTMVSQPQGHKCCSKYGDT